MMPSLFAYVAALLVCRQTSYNALPSEFGLDVSTGYQSTPLSPASIGEVTSSPLLDGVKYFKFFGSSSDHDIALGILAASSSHSDIRFYIGIPDSTGVGLDALDESSIAALVAEWDDLKSNINYIALTNEPGNVNANFSALPVKLEMVYALIRARPGWEHVHVSIPFCCILGPSWPVPESYFKPEYASQITRVLEIYQQYGGVFSANFYPYFVVEHEPSLLSYILGTESLPGEYTSILAAQYTATWYAMQALVPDNTIEIVISETGWSTQGSDAFWWSTLEYAQLFWNSTLRQMSDANAELYDVKIYAFELFDEDLKYGGEHEQHFGLYTLSGESKGVLPAAPVDMQMESTMHTTTAEATETATMSSTDMTAATDDNANRSIASRAMFSTFIVVIVFILFYVR